MLSVVEKEGGSVLLLPAATGDGGLGSKGGSSYVSRRPSHPVKGTAHAAEGLGKTHRAVWFPKRRPNDAVRTVAISGYGEERNNLCVRKESASLPVLPSNSQDCVLYEGHLNSLTVREKEVEGGPGVIGPCGNFNKKAGLEEGDNGPSLLTKNNFGNDDNGLKVISSNIPTGGPSLKGIYVESNVNQVLVGPVSLGIGSNSNGPTLQAREQVGRVEANCDTNIQWGALEGLKH
uniref:Uncharacterized protein n=1 Tax=Cannabis sativa TaxID=3483 RepID=A0A803QLC3_CANSA